MKRISHQIGAVAAVGAALLGAATVAQAQESATPKPIEVKIGVFIPSTSELRHSAGTGLPLIEAEYTIQNLIDNNSVTKIGIGYANKTSTHIMPVTVSQIFRDSKEGPMEHGYYYGAGVGVYFTKLGVAGTSGRTKTLSGGFGVVGWNFNPKVFAEAKYHYISRYDNVETRGLELTVGSRF